MSNEEKKNRTLIEDLPVTEQELTETEMENVQGGITTAGSPAPSSGNTASSTLEGSGGFPYSDQKKDRKTE